jgi:excisionase family DNA binding protein
MLDSDLTLYTVKEVAIILKVTYRTVWNYIKAGKLKAGKIGREWKVAETDLREFVNNSKVA